MDAKISLLGHANTKQQLLNLLLSFPDRKDLWEYWVDDQRQAMQKYVIVPTSVEDPSICLENDLKRLEKQRLSYEQWIDLFITFFEIYFFFAARFCLVQARQKPEKEERVARALLDLFTAEKGR